MLKFPDPGFPYLPDCDVSNERVGAMPSEMKHGTNELWNITERNYCVTWKELLAVVKDFLHFHPYLYGTQFVLHHAALNCLKTLKNPEGQLAQWLRRLEEYHYQLEHRLGRVHGNVDTIML